MDSNVALKQWLIENKVCDFDPNHSFYTHDKVALDRLRKEEPWTKDPHYFKYVHISAIALIKMVIHARSGGSLEIMGLVQGKVLPRTMVVMDAYALPVEGTETRVNAHQDAYEYMVQYQSTSEELGRLDNVLGWYHSHPGYGCWLSGVDVSTQISNQTYQEPFLAIVIDPNRTISSGRVDIGAFRTFPESYVATNEQNQNEYQSIPLNKIEDFGVHANQYYSLDITIFKSPLDTPLLDLLWQRHWVNILAQSPILNNQPYLVGQMAEVVAKLKQVQKDSSFLRGNNTSNSNSSGGSSSSNNNNNTTTTNNNNNSRVEAGYSYLKPSSSSVPTPSLTTTTTASSSTSYSDPDHSMSSSPTPSPSSPSTTFAPPSTMISHSSSSDTPSSSSSSSSTMPSSKSPTSALPTVVQEIHPLGKAAQDAKLVGRELCLGLIHQVLKQAAFNSPSSS